MCRNHSHVAIETAIGVGLPDGTVVYVADGVQDLTLEATYGGGRLTLPPCRMLLMPLQQQGMEYFSPEALMAALMALLCVEETLVTDGGGTAPKN